MFIFVYMWKYVLQLPTLVPMWTKGNNQRCRPGDGFQDRLASERQPTSNLDQEM